MYSVESIKGKCRHCKRIGGMKRVQGGVEEEKDVVIGGQKHQIKPGDDFEICAWCGVRQ